ncbi:uncharacterized protein LOC135537336 [Oncorhynchus masou masou]|uniref:uncharacterized protein LOC135537336 n=1 Tax=Oncorhynchus masou masou TaxID=90313 RepID=UPI00318441E5
MAPTTKEALRPFLTAVEAQPERPRPGVSAAVGSRGPSRDSAEGKADGVSTATTPTSRGTTAPDSAFKDFSEEDLQSLFDSESLWNDDEGGDDLLLYQVCDDVERISNSQPLSEDASVTTDTTEVRFQESKPKAPPSGPLAATREGSMSMDRAVGGPSSKQSTTCTSGRSNSVREGSMTMDRAVGGPSSKQSTTCTSGRSNSVREGSMTMDRAVGGPSSKQSTTCTSGRSNSVREGSMTMDRAVGGPSSKQSTTCTSGRSNSVREGSMTMDRAVGGPSSKQLTTCTSGRSNSVREGSMTMDRAVGGPSSKQSTTCTSGRSNSAPGDGSSTPVHFQRWNIPTKAGNVWVGHHTVTSQSHPGSGEGLGKFTQLKGAPGWGTFGLGSLAVRTFEAENSKSVMPRTVSARTLPNSNSHHASSFKRHLSDSAAIGNKGELFTP